MMTEGSSRRVQAESCLIVNLDDERVEIAADARRKACSCGPSPRMPCNKADAVRVGPPEGVKNCD
jgi:hypothetical protein